MEDLTETEIGSSVESFQKFLESQRHLFHEQIDHLQRLVVTQCKLTGANPLSQEMAAGALSIKIGKRPRDLINPKAVKYMQEVFSIKDAISKKETREISAQFGVTVTQVRDFFASQRTRVRKLVRLSREKSIRVNANKALQDGIPASLDAMMPIDLVPLNSVDIDPVSLHSISSSPVPLNSVSPIPISLNSEIVNPVPLNSASPNPVQLDSVAPDPVPLSSAGYSRVEEVPSCSTQDEILPGLDDIDKHFVEKIFDLLRKEETFSGQVNLMEWILQIQTPSVLNWFLVKGGVMILATWLSQAAAEEQTSFLLVTMKVFCHLPLHKAPPEHLSAILQSVNRLRFYRTSDISNRARVLLTRWSKMFAKIQAMKKPNGVKCSTDAQDMILKQSIDEIMGNELWQPDICNPDDVLAFSSESSENIRKIEPSQALKLLTASTDDPSRKHILGVTSSHTRERRKVQLVEQPGQKTAGRNLQATKVNPVAQGRPMSADDIQKAKMRALFRQGKHWKTGSSSDGRNGMKTGGVNKPSVIPSTNLPPVPKSPVRPKIEEFKKPVIPPPKVSSKVEASLDPKREVDSKEPMGEFCNNVQIPWQRPPEIKLNDVWRIGTGENSKEVDFQKNRNRRGIETTYHTVHEIPSNPNEPWDLEMDYDDTLTPEIPIEQPPDADDAETQVSHNEQANRIVASAPSLPQAVGMSTSEPDLELLAALLKNPELVFALTSGQAGNLSSDETVKLLDMIKSGGVGLAGSLNGIAGKVEEKVEVSLPSPTPSSNPGTSPWRPEDAKNPFSQQASMGNRVLSANASVAQNLASLVQLQNQSTNLRIQQQEANVSSTSQQAPAPMVPFSLPQTSTLLPEKVQPSMVNPSHQSYPANYSRSQTPSSEMVLTMKSAPITDPYQPNISTAIGPPLRVETVHNIHPAPSTSFPSYSQERHPVPFPLSTTLPAAPTQSQLHQAHIKEPQILYSTSHIGNVGPVPDSLRARQRLGTNFPSQVNQTNYGQPFGGPTQQLLRSGPPWERNEYLSGEGFESWSPDNSPERSQEYMSGRNHSGPRMNSGWDHMPNNRSRQRNSYGYWDNNRNGNRRWH